MKKLTIFLFIICFAHVGFTQQTTMQIPKAKTDYLRKSKNQKRSAWILLGIGISSAALSTVHLNFAGYDEPPENNTFLLVTGLAETAASVPLFIASSRNKKKAMEVTLTRQPVPRLTNNGLINRQLPSLCFKLTL